LKPGKLTEAEFEIMKTHAPIGGKLLRQMYERMPTQRYLQYGIMIAEGHHEKFNGSGYPSGIVGEDIPLCARLMAVADVYDALIDSRCYRSGLEHEAACDIIVNGRGSHFDPVLIDIFVDIQDQFRAVAQSLKT
jgi:putative two-component system response regulator